MADNYTVLDGSAIRKSLAAVEDWSSKRFVELDAEGKGVLSGEQARAAAEAEAAALLLGARLSDERLAKVFQGIADPGDQLDQAAFKATVEKYLQAIADALEEEPLVISVLDGSVIRGLLEDEDDFAMMAENLFTELDLDENGKLSRSELRPAILQLGVEMGLPTPSAQPEAEVLLTELFKKYGADGSEELGQAMFAKLLQEMLQDLADSLNKNPIVVIHDLQVASGSRLRKLLADEELLHEVIETAFSYLDVNSDGKLDKAEIRPIFEDKGVEWGLPPLQANEKVEQLFDKVFAIVDADSSGAVDKAEFGILVKALFEHFAEQLQLNPIVVDTEIAYRPV